MRLTAERAQLLAAVAAVLPAAGKPAGGKPPPGVLDAAADGTLAVGTTDGQGGGAQHRLSGADGSRLVVRSPGRLAVGSLSALADYLKGAGGAGVDLHAIGPALVVRGEGCRAELPTLEAEPGGIDPPDPGPVSVTVTLPVGVLRRLVRAAAFAAGRKDQPGGRFALSGVLLAPDAAAGRLAVVATDAGRLAVATAPARVEGRPDPAGYLLPRPAAKLLGHGPADAEAVLSLSPRLAVCHTGPHTTWTPLVSGRFPAWDQILTRAKAPHKVEVPAAALLSALEYVAPAADPDDRAATLRLAGAGLPVLSVEARSSAAGSARREVPLAAYSGPGLVVSFAGGAVDEYLKAAQDLDADAVTLGFSAADKPAVLSAAGAGVESRCLVMPLVERPEAERSPKGDDDDG